MSEWTLILLAVVGAILYKLKSIHIEFQGNGNEIQEEKQIKFQQRKQLKK